MSQRVASNDWSAHQSRFEFAPPRHFLLPAILLLVSEKPGYGYSLVKDLQEFRFGQVDRPSVYRALAQLEADGLVEAWAEAPKAGQARRVYGLTECGERVLRSWMGVVKDERDCLDRVLRRYQATGTTEAALAEVEGGWAAALGHAWSPVSSTCASGRRRMTATGRPTSAELEDERADSPGPRPANPPQVALNVSGRSGVSSGTAVSGPAGVSVISGGSIVSGVSGGSGPHNGSHSNGGHNGHASTSLTVGAADTGAASPTASATERQPAVEKRRFRVVPDRSVVLIEARSTVGPIRFGAIGLTGHVEAEVTDGTIAIDTQPSGHLEISVGELRSGNSLYDAELLRRIDARRFPTVTLELRETNALVPGERYRLDADVTLHGVTRPLRGTVSMSLSNDRKLVVTGEQAFDIRDFVLASPTVLMLRIYPDVRVHLHVEAELED